MLRDYYPKNHTTNLNINDEVVTNWNEEKRFLVRKVIHRWYDADFCSGWAVSVDSSLDIVRSDGSKQVVNVIDQSYFLPLDKLYPEEYYEAKLRGC